MTPIAVALTAPFPPILGRPLTTASALDPDASMGPHTALLLACFEGDNERIRGLLALGTAPDLARRHGIRPLHIATNLGNTEAVKALLRAGADPSWLPGDTATSPLGAACQKGHVGIVQALVIAGARVNWPVRPSRTERFRDFSPLGLASGRAEVVEPRWWRRCCRQVRVLRWRMAWV